MIACYNQNGIAVTAGAGIVSVGSPLQPNWFVRYSCVQEQPVALGSTNPSAGFNVNSAHYGTTAPKRPLPLHQICLPGQWRQPLLPLRELCLQQSAPPGLRDLGRREHVRRGHQHQRHPEKQPLCPLHRQRGHDRLQQPQPFQQPGLVKSCGLQRQLQHESLAVAQQCL